MKTFLKPGIAVILLWVNVACSNSLSQQDSAAAQMLFANDIADAAVMGKWSRSCALCHVNGEAGAPIVGDTREWQRRFAQGESVILEHVLEGFNSMPPLGYCMSCEVDDFRAMIGFMAGTNQ